MDIAELIAALSHPSAYAQAHGDVVVCQTHISAVFLVGAVVYKVKKPVRLGFLDFSTLEQRRHYCAEEVRLNRRLAPSVYLGTVPIVQTPAGIRVEAPGEPIEWAVKMRRLPDSATLLYQLQQGTLQGSVLDDLAQRLAAFHTAAERNASIASFGQYAAVARNARENFEQAQPLVGVTLPADLMAELRARTEATLTRLQPLLDARAERGVPCDTHGDLRLDHVYRLEPPDDLAILDCIEFNERFRYADPVADMAFLVMDLRFQGWPDLAAWFADAYFRAAQDEEGRALLPFYTSYRAAVRGKVEGFKLAESEIPQTERVTACDRAQRYWQLALEQLDT